MDMDIEDLKRLRDHVNMAIEMAELGGLKAMSEKEKRQFKIQFGDYDIVIANFMIKMCNSDQAKPM